MKELATKNIQAERDKIEEWKEIGMPEAAYKLHIKRSER